MWFTSRDTFPWESRVTQLAPGFMYCRSEKKSLERRRLKNTVHDRRTNVETKKSKKKQKKEKKEKKKGTHPERGIL